MKWELTKEERIRQHKQACEKANICYVCGSELKHKPWWNIFNLHLYCFKCNEKRVDVLPKKY